MPKRSLVKIDIGIARRLRDRGYTLGQIAARFGCTRQAVQQRLSYRHVAVPAGPEIVELIKRGFSNSEIAAIVGVTPPTVHYHRAKLGKR